MPKPMAPINGVPFLDYLINSVVKVGIKKILILVGYKSNIITSRYDKINNIIVEYSFGSVEQKTGRRLLNSRNKLDKNFLLLYGDNYWPIEIKEMIKNYKKLNMSLTTTVFSNKAGTGEYGFKNNIVVSQNGLVENYDKKQNTDLANGVDIGYFLISKKSINFNIEGNVSFEEDMLPKFIKKKQLGAYLTHNQYYYITNVASLKKFEIASVKNNFSSLPSNYFGS